MLREAGDSQQQRASRQADELENMTACELLIDGLKSRGIEWMATLCGHGLDPLYHAAKRAGMRLIDTRNEQTAGYIADAYARLTGRPAVCAVSSGVAHVNALTGVLNSWFDGSPMLLISGAGAHRTAGMNHFQDCDQPAMARPMTKYSRVIDHPDRTLQILNEALDIALSDPPGPAHLTFPMDIQRSEAGDPVRPLSRRMPAAADDVESAARSLADSRRPLIIAGSGVFYAGSSEALLRFSERFSIPVVVPIWDRGAIDRRSETFMGVLGAASGGPQLLADADCIIMAGAISDYRVGFLDQTAPSVRFTRDWDALGKAIGDPRQEHGEWLAEARRRREEFRRSIEQSGWEQARDGTHTIHIIEALKQLLNTGACLLIDGGTVGQWAHQLLTDRYPSNWLTCGRSGVVGWGMGGAMAARLAFPGSPVILLSGDGAFTFNVAELECAARQKLHFVAIVADDLGWGITRTGHIRQFGEAIASSLGPIAFDKLAESLGARGIAARSPEEIKPAIEEAIRSNIVTVIHVPIVGGHPG